MIRVFGLLLLISIARAAGPAITAEAIPAPTAAMAGSSALAISPERVVWLSWLEPRDTTTALRCATYDPATRRWTPANTIASGTNIFTGASDFPALTAGEGGKVTALWYVSNPPDPSGHSHGHHGAGYRAVTSQTTDGGKKWSARELLTSESDLVEFASITTLADGRVLAAWLDGREKKKAPKTAEGKSAAAQRLYARIVGSLGPDVLVDASVCDCCHTSLTAFPDGTALLAYRGRSEDEVRDIRVTRFDRRAWRPSHPVHEDAWRIPGCPVNGPQLTSDGGRVAAAWFTAAGDEARVLASFSPDAGARFLMPLRLTESKPAGRVSTVLLHDGAMLISWVDLEGALWLRRVNPDYGLGEPLRLTDPSQGRVKGFPRLALLRDYAGGEAAAEIIATYTCENAPTLRTLLITVPEGDLLEAEKSCDCAPTEAELRGFTIRGSIVETQTDRGLARVKHEMVPGILPAGTHDFLVDPDVLATKGLPGGTFLGRIEREDDRWRLFNLRIIALPQQAKAR